MNTVQQYNKSQSVERLIELNFKDAVKSASEIKQDKLGWLWI